MQIHLWAVTVTMQFVEDFVTQTRANLFCDFLQMLSLSSFLNGRPPPGESRDNVWDTIRLHTEPNSQGRPQQGAAMLVLEEALPQWLGALPVIPNI